MLPIRNVMIIPIKANKAERPKAMPWVAPPVRPNIPSTKGPVPVVPSGSGGETSPRTIVVASGFGLGSKV